MEKKIVLKIAASLAAAVSIGLLVVTFANNREVPPIKKDLGRTLSITSYDVSAVRTGSDAGGCEWDSSKTEESKRYRRAVEKLLRMSMYEMTANVPEGCKTAYYAVDGMNGFTFPSGQLTIPPSGQYPPSQEGSFSHFYRVSFKRNDQEKPIEFCLDEADFTPAVATIEQTPELADCEF